MFVVFVGLAVFVAVIVVVVIVVVVIVVVLGFRVGNTFFVFANGSVIRLNITNGSVNWFVFANGFVNSSVL